MNYKDSEKLNIVHCEIQELINDCPADLELMLKLVEEVRNDLIDREKEVAWMQTNTKFGKELLLQI